MLRKMLVALVLAVGAAIPALADDRADCAEAHVKERAPRAIVACTALIEQQGADAARLAWAYNQRGLAYLRVEPEWREWARADFTRAIRLKPDLAEAYFNRAVSVEWDLADLDKAIALKRDYLEAYLERGGVLALVRRREEAITDYSAALRLEPSAATYVLRGQLHEAAGQMKAAEADYDAAVDAAASDLGPIVAQWSSRGAIALLSRFLERHPGHAEAYFYRGRAQELSGKRDEAISDYLKAWELKAELLFRISDERSGLAVLDQVIARQPGLADAYRLRGWIRWRERSIELAKADLDRAVALEPGFVEALYDRGRLLAKTDGVQAVADLKKVLGLRPKWLEDGTWEWFAWGERVGADAAWMKSLIDMTIEVVPGYAPAYVRRGLAFLETGDIERARLDYERSLELMPGDLAQRDRLAIAVLTAVLKAHPDDPGRLLARARAYARSGEKGAAIADLTALITLRPGSAEAHHLRSRLYRAKGETALALADLKEALGRKADRDADWSEDLYWLGGIYVERKQWDEAIAALTDGIALGGDGIGRLTYARGDAYQGKGASPPAEAIGFSEAYAGSARRWAQRWDQKAIAEWRKGIALDPDLWERWHVATAVNLRSSGDAKGALEELTRGVILAPEAPAAYLARARQLLAMERYDEAIADYDEALRLRVAGGAPVGTDDSRLMRADAYFFRGRAMAAKGAYEDAIADFSKALADVSQRWRALDIYLARAAAHAKAGSYVSAAGDYWRFVNVRTEGVGPGLLALLGISAVAMAGIWLAGTVLDRYGTWIWVHVLKDPAISRIDRPERYREILERVGRRKRATRRELVYAIEGAEDGREEETLVVRDGTAYVTRDGDWNPESVYDRKLALVVALLGEVLAADSEERCVRVLESERSFMLLQYAAMAVLGVKVAEFKVETEAEQAVVDTAIARMRGEAAALPIKRSIGTLVESPAEPHDALPRAPASTR